MPEVVVSCAGKCGATAKVVEPSKARPLLRAVAALVQGLDLMISRNWEFDAASRTWWCRGCRVRRRMLKPIE